jgi:NAD(P)-dependent dehydrogenase (short-subunit alcohol dehydrogenase family)
MKVAILGSSGAIGAACVNEVNRRYPHAEVHTFSRQNDADYRVDYDDETTLKTAAEAAFNGVPFDLVMVTTGVLHLGADIQPEKSLRDLSADKFHAIFAANTIFPALAAKHFLPLLHRDKRSVFAALSARVGSISDNRLGGWYAYRASKAALNMIIKNAAIEIERRHKQAIVVGLHPGTVDSDLSKPFQSNVQQNKLFTPAFSAASLLDVVDRLTPDDSGKCFAWDGQEIPA